MAGLTFVIQEPARRGNHRASLCRRIRECLTIKYTKVFRDMDNVRILKRTDASRQRLTGWSWAEFEVARRQYCEEEGLV